MPTWRPGGRTGRRHWTLPRARRFGIQTKRTRHLSFPPVVSGNPGFYSLSLMARTGFPIGFPITNVGNDRGGTTGMTEGDVRNNRGGTSGTTEGERQGQQRGNVRDNSRVDRSWLIARGGVHNRYETPSACGEMKSNVRRRHHGRCAFICRAASPGATAGSGQTNLPACASHADSPWPSRWNAPTKRQGP